MSSAAELGLFPQLRLAECRKFAIHVNDDANAALSKKPVNVFYASIHIVETMAIAYGINSENEVKGFHQLHLYADGQSLCSFLDQVFILATANRSLSAWLGSDVIVYFDLSRTDECLGKIRSA